MALLIPLIFVALFLVYPIARIVLESFAGSPTGTEYVELARDGVFVRSLIRTFVICLLVTATCLLLGYPIAYELSRPGNMARRILFGMIALTLWISPLVRTFAWLLALQRSGPLNHLLLSANLIDSPLDIVRNPLGIFIGMSHILLPYMVLALVPSMRAIDGSLLAAAQSLGGGRFRTFIRVFVPLTSGGIAAGSLLVFVLGIGFYLTPAILGGPGDLFVSQLIAREITTLVNIQTAAAMSVVLGAATLVIYGISFRLLDPSRFIGVAD